MTASSRIVPDSARGGRRRPPAVVAAAVVVAAAMGCGSSGGPAAGSGAAGATGAAGTPSLSGTLTVFAAASLTEAFTRIGEDFGEDHPGVRVSVNVGGSSALAQQIVSGAPADVFAAANPATMATVTAAGDTSAPPRVFARNRLQIAVPPDDPGRVTGLRDFARPELTIALCAVEVPCGAAATAVFSAAGITPRPDTLEQDVKATLSKVQLGEVDAALVYRTDVLAAGDRVRGIAFPEADTAVNDYPLAPLAAGRNPAAATAFVDHVLSSEGQEVLAAAGFDRP